MDLSFLKHIELSEYKVSNLLAYWINDFAEYHDEERTFNIAKSGIYSRGDVIKVNLGFNIGIFKDTIRRNVKISNESLDLIDKQIVKFFTK